MELLAIGAAMVVAFGFALTLQWAVLAAVVHRITSPARRSVRGGPTSAPPAGVS